MADRSHLVPTPITDQNGKQTTVYRRPERGSGGRPTLPPPPLPSGSGAAAASRVEAYRARLAAIKADDAGWGPKHPGFGAAVSMASECIGTLTMAAVQSHARSEGEQLAEFIGAAFEGERYTLPVMADLFGGVYAALRRKASSAADLADIETLWEWDEQIHAEARQFSRVIEVGGALQGLGLLSRAAVPDSLASLLDQPEEERDLRFLTHLLASARGVIDYSRSDEEVGDLVRLLDEHPERYDEIEGCVREGLHAAAIREQVLGGGAPALRAGAL